MSTLNRTAIQLVQFGSKTANDYYPETLHKCFIVNAPFIFPALWAVIKPFLDEKTARKVTIRGSDYKDLLLEEIDADLLPAFLGGKCTCKEFGSECMMSDIGPWQDYKLVNEPLSIKLKSGRD